MQKEIKGLETSPVENVIARPNGDNLLEWHYVVRGPAETPFAGGYYWGVLRFPPTYPLAPPAILMFTPSGRFRPNTRLCLSISDFHAESWSPLWSCGTILTGLVSFMCDSESTVGSVEASPAKRRQLAAESLAFNQRDPLFLKLFPDVVEEFAQRERASATSSSSSSASSSSSSSSSANEPTTVTVDEAAVAPPPPRVAAPAAVAVAKSASRAAPPRRRFRMPFIDAVTYLALLVAIVAAVRHLHV